MRIHRLERRLAVLFSTLYLLFCHWQSPGEKLSGKEIEQYMQQLEQGVRLPPADKAEFIDHLRAWAEADDGQAFYNFNLMRLYPQVQPVYGAPAIAGSAAQVNAHYESVAIPLLLKLGGYPLVAGGAQKTGSHSTNLVGFEPEIDQWSTLAAVRYASRRSFLQLLTTPEYMAVMPYKMAALKLALVPVDGDIVIPDLRFVLASLLLSLFLLIGWIRSARRLGRLR